MVRELREVVERGATASSPIYQRGVAHANAGRSATERTKGPIKVSITYCAECGYEPQTLALTSALMHEFIYELASIELIPWQEGAFDVVVDGELVHSMYREGGFPENETIIQAVRERLGR